LSYGPGWHAELRFLGSCPLPASAWDRDLVPRCPNSLPLPFCDAVTVAPLSGCCSGVRDS